MKTLSFVFVATLAVGQLQAQDWTTSAPKGKKILVDNDHIKMAEVTILPGQEEPVHTHPQYIEYVIEPAKLLVTFTGKEPKEWNTQAKAYAGDPESPHALKNIDTKPFKCILVELKDRPYISPAFSKSFGEIADAEKKFCDVFAKSGGIGLKEMYADDATILPPNSDMIKGNVAIGNYWKAGFDAGVKGLKLETLEVYGNDEFSNEVGSYSLLDASGNVMDKGKYVVVWKKTNGAWKLYRDIWNSSNAGK